MRIKYIVNRMDFDVTTGKYNSTIVGRDAEIEITGNTEKEVEHLHNNLIERLNEISFKSSDCWSIEEAEEGKYIIVDYIAIDNKEEYEEVKEIYKEWKKEIKETVKNLGGVKMNKKLKDLIKEWDNDFKGNLLESIEKDMENGCTLKESINLIMECFPIWIEENKDDVGITNLYKQYEREFKRIYLTLE